MILTHGQRDALTELVNIAFGLTASKLSEVSGYRVLLEAPVIAIHPMDALARELGLFVTGEVASVHQVFAGPFSGDAVLLMNYESAVKLSNLFIEEHLQLQRLDSSTGEILAEVGNLLLSACLGMFGNLLQVRVTFSMPRLHLDSLEEFLTSIAIGGGESQDDVAITASFHIREQSVDGRIVVVLDAPSLEQLIQAVERWEGAQSSA